ncbi:MAG TPA: DUF6263 family protein [Candidatus Kapabacteria bacterium]|nr:DUF6263 family protein [Candidatus Kapabacteria bacterium]
MRTTLCILLFTAAAAFAESKNYIGNKFIPGDTAWYETHSVSSNRNAVADTIKREYSANSTKMEQTVYHHQYATKDDSTGIILVTLFDNFKMSYTIDSTTITYNSSEPGDSSQLYNMMVFPMHALLHHPLTVYINAKGTVDSVTGLEKAIRDASKALARSSEIEKLRAILNKEMISDLIESALANLPNKYMNTDQPLRLERERMVGKTQFIDDFVTRLQKIKGDTAVLSRMILTRAASPTMEYNGKQCIIDSSNGYGSETIIYDMKRGIVTNTHEVFNSVFRGLIPNSTATITQNEDMLADVTMTKYSPYNPKKAKAHGKRSKK